MATAVPPVPTAPAPPRGAPGARVAPGAPGARGATGTTGPLVSLLLATVVGGAAYLLLAGLLKVEELDYVRNVISRR